MPVVPGRFVSLNGKTLDQLEGAALSPPHVGERRTELGGRAAGRRQGHAGPVVDRLPAPPSLAMGEGVAQRLQLGIGSAVELESRRQSAQLKNRRALSRRRPAPGRARAVHSALRPAQRRAGHLVRRRAHRSPPGGRHRTRALRGLSHGHCHQSRRRARAHRERGRPDHFCGALPGRLLDPCRIDHPGLQHRQHALPPHEGGRGA